MITMIARMRVPPEHATAYEDILTYVTNMTLKHEPGVPYYGWSKSADKPDMYVVIEIYNDEKAHAQHMAAEWVKNSIPVSLGLVDGKIDIEQFVSPGQAPVKLQHG